MITEAIFSVFGAILGFALDLIPDGLGVPTFLEDAMGAFLNVIGSAKSLAVWVPIPLVIAAAGFRIAVLLGAISVKSLRQVVSLFTGGGGSAA